MTITVRFSNLSEFLAVAHRHQIAYNSGTKFLFGQPNDNQPGSLEQVKHNSYISCAGAYNAGKPQLIATECVYRNAK